MRHLLKELNSKRGGPAPYACRIADAVERAPLQEIVELLKGRTSLTARQIDEEIFQSRNGCGNLEDTWAKQLTR